MTKIAFLDRDGVLNEDYGYVSRPEDFKWIPGAKEAILWLKQQGFVVAIATNQSGIGRDLYSLDDFLGLMEWMESDLSAMGATIDAVYYCPHHPDAENLNYREDCECRKPKAGMLLQGLREFQGDPNQSFFIGDKPTDMEAAAAAGIQGILYEGGSLLDLVRRVVATSR